MDTKVSPIPLIFFPKLSFGAKSFRMSLSRSKDHHATSKLMIAPKLFCMFHDLIFLNRHTAFNF